MITILLIEDEIKTARELQKDIEKTFDDVVVVAILATITEAVRWLKENAEPDIIFSDIQLADGLSFEIYKRVAVKSPIIFCTAFDEYAIEAFKTFSIDYLLKPIDEEKLIQSINKYKLLKQTFTTSNGNENIKKFLMNDLKQQYKKTILIHHQEKIIPIKTDNIAYFHYELGTVYLHTFEGKKHFINQALDEIEQGVNPQLFFKANRQFIINRTAIHTIENYYTRRLLVRLLMPTSEDIIVSKTKSPLFLKWIENV
ncbi:MAG: LytTR family DNA-binding domain-containing protein [Flavobacterium sp.]|nr:LytTR family DNA-binding domain-containing protein [Flavobacterium sp.]